ncbi:hypothetical protein [Paenibacillus rigui]|uniref:Uncharacterized protein n=1 Tax=Paenibacillus rigui TaxID=554312 RepID=A0A229UWB6_9BACL|nr:hypothetical protein [Paenibacillus rigui]OXM87199.1 hypothetical protein CF651_06000 [Paenibacillus rigui]
MKAWWNLFKKELAFGSKWSGPLWIYLLIVLLMGGLSIYFSYRFHSGAMSGIWLAIIYLHFMGPTVYMLISLKKERDYAPLWLQLPLSGWKLLTAKYAAAMCEFGAGLLVSTGFFLWMFTIESSGATWSSDNQMKLSAEFEKFSGFFHGSHLETVFEFMSMALALAISCVLLYLMASAMTNRFGPWRWPLAILILGTITALENVFEHTWVYRFLFHWGTAGDTLYAGEYVWICINMVICLYASVWLLDRKEEV